MTGQRVDTEAFLPVDAEQARARGWHEVDFVLVSGDAYVDHPSFGGALLARVLAAEGWRVGILPQPNVQSAESFKRFGPPRLAFLISGGVVDSMVAHYTVAKRRRTFDEYSPGGKAGLRPDRAVEVYAALAKQAYPELPVIVGGVEASLRRFAHYDYWSDEVRPSLLLSSGADAICFGMGENALREAALRLRAGGGAKSLRGIAGMAWLARFEELPGKYAECASFAKVKADKTAYAKACRIQQENQEPRTGLPLVQKQTDTLYLVQNLPAAPLARSQLDEVYALPFTRRWHPMYDAAGGVPGLEEVQFSIAHNRGCYGGCNFCAITLHQGRVVTSRSEDSVVAEARALTALPGFKGYIHDVGGPTANFRGAACEKMRDTGACTGAKKCLAPGACPKLRPSHAEYLAVLRRLRTLPGVKKVFIRSGIRYDYLLYDPDESFFKDLVAHHVSGQLKVAPEHCVPGVLRHMGKPPIGVYERFSKRFFELSQKAGKEQYLVPYLISSHPGSSMKDAAALAEWLHKNRLRPEQVQDFYPTPGTVSTCMYHTGLDPFTMKPVYVAKAPGEKAMQRALLQYFVPGNRELVKRALRAAGREDLEAKLLREGRPGAPKARAARTGSGAKAPGGKRAGTKPAGKSTAGKRQNAPYKGVPPAERRGGKTR